MAALQRLLEETPAYAELITGHPPGPEAAKGLLNALPQEMTHDSKYVYGFMVEGPAMIGCADILRGWPTPNTALIALLLIDEAHRGIGLGRSTYQLVETKVQGWPEIDMLRISMMGCNDAVLSFWRHMGFTETGEVAPYVYDKIDSESVVLVKPLRT
jgi:uncharacterized protein